MITPHRRPSCSENVQPGVFNGLTRGEESELGETVEEPESFGVEVVFGAVGGDFGSYSNAELLRRYLSDEADSGAARGKGVPKHVDTQP